jgi:hypothetical protein
MGHMSRLGWLVVLVKHAIWASSLYLLHLLFLSIFANLSAPLNDRRGSAALTTRHPSIHKS